MAQNVVINGVTYSSVPEVDIPTGGGGTLIDKTITANGMYDAEDDDADGYSSVTVNVPSGSPTLQSKTVSYTPSESTRSETVTADSGYDGLNSVAVSVGAVSGTYVGSQVPTQAAQTIHPSTQAQSIDSGKYLTGAQTIEAVTTNLTADKIVEGFTAKIGSASDDDCVANITGTASGGGATVETGTYTPASDYTTTSNHLIVSIADIGFTPSKFILSINNYSDITATQYVVLFSTNDSLGGTNLKVTSRTSNTSGGVNAAASKSALTTQTNGFLYNNGTGIYFRTTSSYKLLAAASYTWTAYK